jgi:hypothetical protein
MSTVWKRGLLMMFRCRHQQHPSILLTARDRQESRQGGSDIHLRDDVILAAQSRARIVEAQSDRGDAGKVYGCLDGAVRLSAVDSLYCKRLAFRVKVKILTAAGSIR